MENTTLDHAVKVVRASTTKEEQRRLAEALLADGLIERLPARYQQGYDPTNDVDRNPPISVIGRSVSETLLEDREPH